MKRPLLPVALCYVAGLLLGDFFKPSLAGLFVVASVVFLCGLFISRLRPVLLWLLLVLVGWTNMVARTAVLAPDDLRRLTGDEQEIATMRGVLEETPSLRVREVGEVEMTHTMALVRVRSLIRKDKSESATGLVMVSTRGDLPSDYFKGSEVEITGVLGPPPLPVSPLLFDYRSYLARQGIYRQIKASTAEDWKLVSATTNTRPLADRFLLWSQRTLAHGMPVKDEPLRLIWAMTLGWKTALTDEVSEPFMRSGTMHIFAISGLHIALIAAILVGVLRVVRVPRMACGFVVIPLIWFYTGATGWQSSAIRSTVMMTIIVGGWALRRPGDLLNSLAAAGLVILAWDPQQLFQASFQLSFFVVLSLALFLSPLEVLRDRVLELDPLLPRELLPPWKRALRAVLRVVLTSFATSLAAWLGALPLSAYYFHLFSPVTLLANLIVVPMSSAALACNLGSLFCGDWFPWATELFNHCGWFWMAGMVKVSQWSTELPGAFYYVPAPSWLTFVFYYGFLIGTLNGWLWKPEQRRRTILALVVVTLFYGWQWLEARNATRLTVLPLNGAHGVFVDNAGHDHDWMFDCGNTNSFEFVTRPLLHAKGVNTLPQLALTHGDLKHVGATEEFVTTFRVSEIYAGPVRFRSATYRRLASQAEEDGWKIVKRGDKAGIWEVLHPALTDTYAQADDGALVLLGEFHGVRVLLLSDLGRTGQNDLIARTRDLRADIVVTGLPVKTEPLCDALLDVIQPKLIVVADSEFPATERASGQLRDRLDQRKIPVLYTRQTGALEFNFNSRGWKVSGGDGSAVSFPKTPSR
ncbi:MAG: DUF4131 domain-containing protein [Verrucomicrobia bacterium]|nr:DUF4131 domain-containing protein [Verrucomicrobiota bacterium]